MSPKIDRKKGVVFAVLGVGGTVFVLMTGRVEISSKQIIAEPHKRRAIDTRSLPTRTVDLSSGDLSLEELLGLAAANALRVIARNGESYVISRLVV